MRVMASLLFPNSNQGQHLVSRGILNLLSPEYAVNKCLIIANSIRDYNIMNRHSTWFAMFVVFGGFRYFCSA